MYIFSYRRINSNFLKTPPPKRTFTSKSSAHPYSVARILTRSVYSHGWTENYPEWNPEVLLPTVRGESLEAARVSIDKKVTVALHCNT
jgi:hypothetical protein